MKALAVYAALADQKAPRPDGVIILQFASVDGAKTWYANPYAPIPFRQKAAGYRAFIVDGL